MLKRKEISKRLRFEIFKRDSFKCQYCGLSAPDVLLEVDHIIPVKEKGSNDPTNLITSCKDCNKGKSGHKLDDNSVIEKQRRQLEELNARREQMKLMLKWRQELDNLDNEKLKILTDRFVSLTGNQWTLNEIGLKNLRSWIKKYPMDLLLEAIDISTQQYLKLDKSEKKYTTESWNKAFNYIPRICASKRKIENNPFMKDLYYIRGIVRNRMYCNDIVCMQLLKDAYYAGIPIDNIKDLACKSRNWTDFRISLENWIEETRHES
jgi:hypothetical protein